MELKKKSPSWLALEGPMGQKSTKPEKFLCVSNTFAKFIKSQPTVQNLLAVCLTDKFSKIRELKLKLVYSFIIQIHFLHP